jgi:formylmethanofuran dehydrogenase subunit B
LLRLVIDLNRFTRFHARRLRVVGYVSGADSVLCWQTGYPFSVNLSRGYPRYSPGEYSAADVLENKEADALLLIGASRTSSFSQAALDHMKSIPKIVLERVNAELSIEPTVLFTTATYGIHRSGTAYRMDEIPIRLRPILESSLPTDGDILRAIQAAL